MLKMRKSNIQQERFKKVTIMYGYTLFALWVVALVIYTVIPMTTMLFNPAVRHFNGAVLLISLVAGAILPPLVSYTMGDRVTHSKDKNMHHFNGVLLGIASYWFALFFSFVGAYTVSGIRSVVPEPWATLLAGWPILATLCVMIIPAVSYAKTRKEQLSLLEHKAYRITLLVGLIATFAFTLYNQYLYADTSWTATILTTLVPVVFIAITYLALRAKTFVSPAARFTTAIVTVSIGFIAASGAGQLVPYTMLSTIIPIAAGVLAWFIYLLLILRTS